MPKGGNDISQYSNGKYRVRVYRKHTRYYLGMYPSYEDAFAARERFLIDTNNGETLQEPEPEKYTKRWFEQQAEQQRIDFITRYSG